MDSCNAPCLCLVVGHLSELHHPPAFPAAHERHGPAGGHRLHRGAVPVRIRSFGFCDEGAVFADVWSTASQLKH